VSYKYLNTILALILTMLSGFITQVQAQDIDIEAVIEKHSIACSDIAFSASELIPKYHTAGQTDTLRTLLRYWEEKCGITEPMMRFAILWQIQTREFNDDWLPALLPDYLDDYREAATADDTNLADYYFDFDAWAYYALHPGYNDYTRSLASDLLLLPDLSATESFLTLFYAHNFEKAVEHLNSGMLAGTSIDSLYLQRERELQQLQEAQTEGRQQQSVPGFHVGFSFGTWMPTDELKLLGNHPQLGFLTGGNTENIMFQLQLNLSFLEASQAYSAEIGSTNYETTDFLQVYAGLNTGFDMLNNPKHSLYITGGIGYDGIDPRNNTEREEGITGMIHALNINAGITYHRIFNENRFFSIIVRHNFVDYRNHGGTDLSGNVVSIGIGYGFQDIF
jgi:hypothetical protein